MKPDSLLKWMDWIGLSLLVVLLGLAYLIRIYPEALMDPGFPILREKSIASYPYIDGIPFRASSLYEPEKVIYINRFVLPDDTQTDTSFAVEHKVTRYTSPTDAILAFQTASEKYSVDSFYQVVTIPDLDFTSHADEYWLWCEQVSENAQPRYNGELVQQCHYWSVYGPFYSELWMYFHGHLGYVGGDRYFSLEIFNDLLQRADQILSAAR